MFFILDIIFIHNSTICLWTTPLFPLSGSVSRENATRRYFPKAVARPLLCSEVRADWESIIVF